MASRAVMSSTGTECIGKTKKGYFSFHIAETTEYLVKTGLGIKGISVDRKFFLWPGQKLSSVDLKPRNISFELHSISKDLVPFSLPTTFTIAPHDPETDMDGFKRYAQRMNGLTEAEFHTILTGVIHGQTRILAGKLNVMQIFNDRDAFKMNIQVNVEKELIPWGLSVTNANVSELRDMPGEENKYFASLQMKAISGATNDARVEVAEAKKRGDIGTATRDGEASVETTRINAANVTARNARQQEIERSNNQLRLVKLECEQEQAVRQKEAQMAPMNREAILQTELNKLDAMKQLEFLRSTQFAKATVEAESLAKVAEGRATATKLEADADLYKAQKEAEAILAKAQAQAEGLQRFMDTAEPDLVKFYLGLERNLFVDMAQKTAQAVQGLNPKINIWNTGASGESDAMSPLRNLFTSIPPMLDAVQTQTGVRMPSWMPQQATEA